MSEERKEKEPRTPASSPLIMMAGFGALLGILLAPLFGDITTGIAIGASIGVVLGLLLQRRKPS